MQALRSGGKDRAGRVRVVAHRDDEVETLRSEFVDGLGTMTGDIDADLLHRCDRLWTHSGRRNSSGEDFEFIARLVPEQSFRHLAARGVRCAQDQDARPVRHSRKARTISRPLASRRE